MGFKEHTFEYSGVKFPVLLDEFETIISNSIDKTGVWESNQLILYHSLVGRGGVFVDIGANVGVNSLFMSKIVPDARIISIEPSPQNFDLLERNIEGSKIEAHCIAAADIDGVIKFVGSGTNAKIDQSIGTIGSISVIARRLDALIEEYKIEEISLLKIDVEGYTDLVLSGAKETLRRSKHVIIEFSIIDIQDRFKCDLPAVALHFTELFDLLSPYYSHFYYISREDGLVRIDNAIDLMDLLAMEHSVGDILVSNEKFSPTISPMNLFARRVAQLLPENHKRIVDIQNLHDRIAELDQRVRILTEANPH